MNRDDYQQVKQIFQSALDIAPGKRTAYLNEKCSGNPQFRREVEKLLNSFESDYLEQPAVGKIAEVICAGNLSAGQEIGHYRIVEKIGAGGMGEVYLAEDFKLDRQVAIKILSREFTEDAERIRRFIREAKSASALNHPNIITIHEIGETGDSNYIVTEFIEGKTLRQHLSPKQTNSLSQILKIGVQVAEALSAAHQAGIIHRDIKPENIMIREDGYAKVLDFGLAKLTEQKRTDEKLLGAASSALVRTNPGMVMGTVQYMSPEQARGKETDARTDIWSLGTVLYEMLAGNVPFNGETTNHTIVSILEKEPKLLENVPAELQRIVRKTLTKEVEMRYQTARDLLIDLKNLRRALDIQGELERSFIPNYEVEDQVSENARQNSTGRSIEETTAEPSASATQNVTSSSLEYAVAKVKQYKFVYLTLAVMLVAGIGFGIYKYSGGKKAELSFESAKINRVTASDKATIAGISPDGKYIVHAVDDAGKQSLWVRQTVTGSNIQIVPPAEVSYWGITVSPDGNFVYYVARDVGKGMGSLYRIPLLGGTAVPLVTDVDSPVAISPDGSQMAFVRWAADSTSRLFAANIDGTAERELIKRDKPEALSGGGPAWSPDGKTVVCALSTIEATSLLSVRVSDGMAIRLTQTSWDTIGQIAWFNGDTIIMIASDRDPNSTNQQLWSVSLIDGQATQITRDINNYRGVSLSTDSRTLVTTQSNTESNVFIGQAGDEVNSKELTSSKGSVTDFNWTADGRILYDSMPRGNWDIFSVKTDGTDQQSLTTDPNLDYMPTPSGDGRYIVFSSNRTGSSELWRMNADGKNPIQLTTRGGLRSSITPNGKWVVYTGGNDSRIFKISIDGGEPEPVVDDRSVSFPVVSPDGRTIAYWGNTGAQNGSRYVLKIMPISGGPAIKTLELPPTAAGKRIQFSTNGQTILYLDTRNGVSNIWSQPVDGGKPKQITDFKSGIIMSFAYSPDGRQLGFTKDETISDVVMISGFKK